MAAGRCPGVVVLMGAALISGCAARGGTPRPFPSPPDRDAHAASPPVVATAPAATALLQTALGLVGTPYRAGGQVPETGFDCSGFVTWVFGQHGVPLPRTVAGLFSASEEMPAGAAPAPADLVFFQTEAPGPTHVGIALGDGRFVHAPSSRGAVRVETLALPYWDRRYLGARRVRASTTALAGPR